MATYAKAKLSGSTDGMPIDVTGTQSTDANTIHLMTTSTNVIDEIYLWANNQNSSCAVKLVIEYGTTATTTIIENQILAEQGLMQVLPGTILVGHSGGTRAIKAYVNISGVTLCGFVNRITQ